MPQFSVKVRVVGEPGVHHINVWAESVRDANRQALKVATKLLGATIELV